MGRGAGIKWANDFFEFNDFFEYNNFFEFNDLFDFNDFFDFDDFFFFLATVCPPFIVQLIETCFCFVA